MSLVSLASSVVSTSRPFTIGSIAPELCAAAGLAALAGLFVVVLCWRRRRTKKSIGKEPLLAACAEHAGVSSARRLQRLECPEPSVSSARCLVSLVPGA